MFERCLGWRVVLVEAQPARFASVVRSRPHALSLRMAACESHGVISLTGSGSGARCNNLSLADPMLDAESGKRLGAEGHVGTNDAVRCAVLGDVLLSNGISRVDIFSLDVRALPARSFPHP